MHCIIRKDMECGFTRNVFPIHVPEDLDKAGLEFVVQRLNTEQSTPDVVYCVCAGDHSVAIAAFRATEWK